MTPDQIEQTLTEWDLWTYAFYEGRNFLPTALVFVWDPKKRCLILVLTKNAHARAENGGKKAFKPAGGGHHPREDDCDIIRTAVREVKEELGILPEALQFVGPLCDPVTLLVRPVDKQKLEKKGFRKGKAYFGLLFVTTGPYDIVRQESEITSVRRVYSRKGWTRAIDGNRPKMRRFLNQCLRAAEKTGVVKFKGNPKKRKQKKKK